MENFEKSFLIRSVVYQTFREKSMFLNTLITFHLNEAKNMFYSIIFAVVITFCTLNYIHVPIKERKF